MMVIMKPNRQPWPTDPFWVGLIALVALCGTTERVRAQAPAKAVSKD
jgi:hypothetical protein